MKMKRHISSDMKGFTLAELLIVVAIIAVLVVIAIPIFTSQLEKSRESTDFANVRSAYAEMMVAANGDDASAAYNGAAIKQGDGSFRVVVSPLKQQQDGWATNISSMSLGGVPSGEWTGQPQKLGSCTITYSPSTGKTAINWGNKYANMSLTQLWEQDNGERIKQDQETLTSLGNAILAKGWTIQNLKDNLGILIDGSNIRIADYYQLKNGSYDANQTYSSNGFMIASKDNTMMYELLQSIGYNGGSVTDSTTPPKISGYTTGGLPAKTYENSLFYSNELASNKLSNYAIDQTKRSIIINNIKTDSTGKITGFTLYTKAMDNEANLTTEQKAQFSFKIGQQ